MSRPLESLASLYGIAPTHVDGLGETRRAPDETLVAALRALGAPLSSPHEAEAALQARREEIQGRILEPVSISWEGHEPGVRLRAGSGGPGEGGEMGAVECRLLLEEGTTVEWTAEPESAPDDGRPESPSGPPGPSLRLGLPRDLSRGVHDLRIRTRHGRRARSRVVRSPARAFPGPVQGGGSPGDSGFPDPEAVPGGGGPGRRGWGLFLPLHALRTSRSWGTGDLTDLGELARWTAGRGGAWVGVLPLLSTFLDRPFDPSPYAPASRLFWSELWADPRRAPGLEECPGTREILQSRGFRKEVEALRDAPRVDYRQALAVKRRVLETWTSEVHQGAAPRVREELEAFLESRPLARSYARFRAVTEARGEGWRAWPGRLRAGELRDDDFRSPDARYHGIVQWLLQRQLAELAPGEEGQTPLYLDLPLGVHPEGFDPWRWPELFAEGFSVGAPPDAFHREGQSWGFPPLAPDQARRGGHPYWRRALRTSLRHAGLLRLDHVMALHRQYWIPEGRPPADGVYVGYPAEELWALLCLESWRHRTVPVGEDLGTVPPEVRDALDERGVPGMYVIPFELREREEGTELAPVPPSALACLDTHDTPTLAGFWTARDVDHREERKGLGPEEARTERHRRARMRRSLRGFLARRDLLPPAGAEEEAPTFLVELLTGLLRWLARSPARLVSVNLEDLWLETEPQNVPGTSAEEHPNWRRKARYHLEEIMEHPRIEGLLEEVDALRRAREPEGAAGENDRNRRRGSG